MTRTMTMIALLAAGVAAPRAAAAAVPARVPVQGYLTDANGDPIDGTTQIEVRIYDVSSGGAAWFTESHAVDVDRGELTVYLGSVQNLDLSGFAGGAAFLGITIVGEAEMTPRLTIGSVPYAAYAQETASVPPGAVMMFDLDACPPGWSALTEARGRALVGAPSGGTVLGTVGTAFTDLENRSHTHGVPALSGTAASAGAHSHTVSSTTASATVNWAHTHTIDVPSHQHRWASYYLDPANGFSTWSTYVLNDSTAQGGAPLQGWGNGVGNDGSGYYVVATPNAATAPPASPLVRYTQMTDIAAFTSGAASTSSSTHTHDFSATSSTTGAHTHTVATTAATSNGATTGEVMPYLQLLVCRKD
jgi:hypothetical protein